MAKRCSDAGGTWSSSAAIASNQRALCLGAILTARRSNACARDLFVFFILEALACLRLLVRLVAGRSLPAAILTPSTDTHGAQACLRAAMKPIWPRGCPGRTAASTWGIASPKRCLPFPSSHSHDANRTAVRAAPPERHLSVSRCFFALPLRLSTYVEFLWQALNRCDNSQAAKTPRFGGAIRLTLFAFAADCARARSCAACIRSSVLADTLRLNGTHPSPLQWRI